MSLALRLAVMLAATASVPATAQQHAANPAPAFRSATVARDIGGFALGMNIREAAKLSPMDDIGNGQFQTERDGVSYDFSVTDAGRIYRVQSTQKLGRFGVDRTFLKSVRDKLATKFGPPEEGSGGSYSWELVELVPRVTGEPLAFKTNWASAYIASDNDGVSLVMTMLDFRLLWHDEAAANLDPRAAATDQVRL